MLNLWPSGALTFHHFFCARRRPTDRARAIYKPIAGRVHVCATLFARSGQTWWRREQASKSAAQLKSLEAKKVRPTFFRSPFANSRAHEFCAQANALWPRPFEFAAGSRAPLLPPRQTSPGRCSFISRRPRLSPCALQSPKVGAQTVRLCSSH